MRLILLTKVLFSARLLASQSVEEVGFTRSTHSMHGFSPKGSVPLSVLRLQVDVHYRDDKVERGDLFVIYDPQTGHYIWLYGALRPDGVPSDLLSDLESGKWAIYVEEDKIVEFVVQADLDIQERGGRAASLDAAGAATLVEMERWVATKKDRIYNESIQVPLYRAIGGGFACPEFGSNEFTPTCRFHAEKISSVTREGDNWRLVIENRWAQEVALDSKFALVRTKRIAPSAQ